MKRCLSLLVLLSGPVLAQEGPGNAALAAAQRLDVAGTLLEAADSRNDRVAALTETVQAYEAGLVAMRDGLRRAAIAQRQIEANLQAKSAEIGQLLGALQSMGRAPAPLLLLHPNGPLGTARAGMIAADVTPALQTQVVALRDQLEQISDLQQAQRSAAETLADGLRGAQSARAALSEAIQDRTDLPQRFTEDPVQTALLIASSETLTAFADNLSQTFLSDGQSSAAVPDKGNLPPPVQGQLLRRFNAPDAAGIARPGVIIAARPRALVTTPVAATLLFRGDLLNYGNVSIIEPAADVLMIFAGMAEVFGEAGQVLPAGSPLGLLGGDQPDVNAILTQNDGTGGVQSTQTLYLEIREGQSPVDPASWFALE